MAKQKFKKPQNIVCECKLCINAIQRDNKLHCKIYILDLNKPFTSYSEVRTKIDCSYFGARR